MTRPTAPLRPSSAKSTNIRAIINVLASRLVLKAAFRLAPGWAAAYAARLFLIPLRRPAPSRSGYTFRGAPLAVEAPSGPVAAWLYGRRENPAGPAILLVHGWEDDHRSWAGLADKLVRRGYQVLTLDLPGHGRSKAKLASLPIQAAAIAAVAREANALGLTPFRAVIAHSLGGTATLIAATEMGLRAERFAILAAPNHPRLFAGALMKVYGLNQQRTAKAFAEIERLVGRSMDSLYLPPKLRQLAAPGLILHSRDDRTVPLQHSQENAAAWPRADFRILNGLGHRRLMTDPGVHEMLLHFVTADAPADAFGLKPEVAA
jgi:Lysophospholipase